MPTLADSLSTILLRLWPERRHQERLLDLGERKAWADADRDGAVDRLASWLVAELGLSERLADEGEGDRTAPLSPAKLPLDGVEPVPGVGAHTVALARLVGTAPKTLANTLAGPLRPDRRDHRWVLFLARLERGEADADALVFHRRSPSVVSAELGRAALRSTPDAGDAMLLMSLVALWQRRRPTSEAKAARCAIMPRRHVPKPVVAMKWDVVALTQVRPLVELSIVRGGAFGQTLAAVVLDATLTEAHLAPHRSRGTGKADVSWSDLWLRTVEGLVGDPRVVGLIGEDEAALFRWRVGRMRAYASGIPAPALPPPTHPYVALATAIDGVRAGGSIERRHCTRDPGYFMLLPQARRLGLIEDL